MKRLNVFQLKPNPIGRDYRTDIQLAREWVDIKNVGDESYPLDNIKLQHIAYSPVYPKGAWSDVVFFKGSLGSGEIVRIHSGTEIPLSLLLPEDSMGANYHIFTYNKNFVWNNDENDTARIVNTFLNIEIDKASYFIPVEEGRILKRQGDSLL